MVYGIDPLGPLDLVPRPLNQMLSADTDQRLEEIKKLHEHVRDRIKRFNSTYSAQANKHQNRKVFKAGDLVWCTYRRIDFHPKGRVN